MSQVLRYLEEVKRMRDPSSEAFVLEHGRLFTTLRAEQPKPGTPKQCYYNAARMVRRSKGQLIFVEGYALAMIPLPHAWCIDLEGQVVETTWRPTWRPLPGDTARVDYYGIPFSTDYLVRSIKRWGQYSLLDNWRNNWPVQHSPRSKWIHPAYDTPHKEVQSVK